MGKSGRQREKGPLGEKRKKKKKIVGTQQIERAEMRLKK